MTKCYSRVHLGKEHTPSLVVLLQLSISLKLFKHKMWRFKLRINYSLNNSVLKHRRFREEFTFTTVFFTTNFCSWVDTEYLRASVFPLWWISESCFTLRLTRGFCDACHSKQSRKASKITFNRARIALGTEISNDYWIRLFFLFLFRYFMTWSDR